MGRLIAGMGMAHSFMVLVDGDVWPTFGEMDRHSTLLVDTSGRSVTFPELEARNGRRYEAEADPANLVRQARKARAAIDRLRAESEELRPDVVVVVGNDQMELLGPANMPALSVFYGDRLRTRATSSLARFTDIRPGTPLHPVLEGYGTDRSRTWPGAPDVGLHLIRSLLDQNFDVGAMSAVADPEIAGIGHAFGIVAMRLMGERKTPMVPVFVNTYWPPNQFRAARAYDLGLAIRRAIDDLPDDVRVLIVASGGLSHFVTDEALDRMVIGALLEGSEPDLRGLPEHLLNSGNSEIRNWVVVAAACRDMRVDWLEYEAVYRTPAGTGCGLAFARWATSSE
jgi:hypothetical protein